MRLEIKTKSCALMSRQQRSIYIYIFFFTPGCNSSPSSKIENATSSKIIHQHKKNPGRRMCNYDLAAYHQQVCNFLASKTHSGHTLGNSRNSRFYGGRNPEKIQGTRKAKDSEFGSCFKTPQSGRRLVRRFSPLAPGARWGCDVDRGPYEFGDCRADINQIWIKYQKS